MYTIKIPILCDTSVSYECPYDNFSDLNYLKSRVKYSVQLNKTLFKLPNDLFNILQNHHVTSSKLCFKGEASQCPLSNIDIYENDSDYDFKTVNWYTCPPIVHHGFKTTWHYNRNSNRIESDISNILSQINHSHCFYKGFQIICHGQDLGVLLCSTRSDCPPYLELEVNPCLSSSSYLLANINNSENPSSITVPTGGVIPFNSVENSKNIYLNPDTSEIIITTPGEYTVDWWISYSGSLAIDNLVSSLKKSNAILYSSSTPITGQGFFSGHSLLKVTPSEIQDNYIITLNNTSIPLNSDLNAGAIKLSPVSMPASIKITTI